MNDRQRATYRAYRALCEQTDKELGLPGHGAHIRHLTEAEQTAYAAFEASLQEEEPMKEGTLIASSNRGRYAFDDEQGPPYSDITSGQLCAIQLAGQWVSGSVEHTHSLYADEVTGRVERGYYFIAEDGSRCGLCVGMRVRIP